jgi:hypothetical protein
MSFRFRRPIVVAAALSALSVVPAFGQEQSTEFPSWQVPGWSFTPGIVFGALYDTNVAIASPGVGGKTASDKLFRVEPFGQLEFFSPRTTFNAGYRGSLRRYFELSDLDGVDHRAFMSLRERVSRRVTFFANNHYSQVPTTDLLELNGVPFQRSGARHNALIAGVDARLSKRVDFGLSYENTWVDFVRKDTILTGGVVNGIQTDLTYRFNERASAGAEYGFRWADMNQGTKQTLFQDVGGVVRYLTSERTSFALAAGLAYLLDRVRDVTRTGPYVKAELTHRAERATVGGEYRRSYVPSLAFGGTNQSQEARGYVHMPLGRNRLYVQESASWRRTDPFADSELPLDSIVLQSTLGYAVQRWFRVEGYHAFTTQDNRIVAGKISRHVAGVQFVVSEPMRIR